MPCIPPPCCAGFGVTMCAVWCGFGVFCIAFGAVCMLGETFGAFGMSAVPPPIAARSITSVTVDWPSVMARESASSFADWKRLFGSRSAARAHQRSNCADTFAISEGTGTGATMIFTSRSPRASLSNGSRPVTIWKTMTASDQRSLRQSTPLVPCACSGLM